ncbi:MAG: SNF2-related protein, partial [Sphingomonas sp.]|uniref:SNF2-related protein n=1 Tax=Sphingomonas sp. TaxID=28214 RepID=UPI003F7E6AA8
MSDTPTLRDKQVEQLSFYIANPKCLDLSDPGTGKTPPCCVYAYYVWSRLNKMTLWTMPKSLLKKNMKEMLRFTEFSPKDVVILRTDRANLTQKWTGPTIQSTRRIATWELEGGVMSHTLRYGPPRKRLELQYRDSEGALRLLKNGKEATLDYDGDKIIRYTVSPKLGPDGNPIKQWIDVPENFKDLIADAANNGAKVVICTYQFAREHWERLFKHFDIDLFLVDELHMGYGGPNSALTESFYWINKKVSRFVGMTGTLINGRLDSAFPAIHVIEPRYYGSLQGFYYEHAAVTDDYDRVVLWMNEAKLRDIIERHSIRRTFEEVYGEEPVVFFTQYVDMTDSVRAEYDKFHEQAMLELEDGSVLDGTMPGVALTRARQIMAHPETMMLGKQGEQTGKDERIELLLNENVKTIIFAALHPEQERIRDLALSMGKRVAMINSDTPGNVRERINEQAEAGELDVIVASGATAAVGFNWELFDLVIFASIDFLDVNILQAYRRASRGNRTKLLRVIFLQYRNSVDQK